MSLKKLASVHAEIVDAVTEACGITACSRCDNTTEVPECLECLHVDPWIDLLPRSFVMNKEGKCVLPAEIWLKNTGWYLLFGIFVLIVLAIILHGFVVRVIGAKTFNKISDAMKESVSEKVSLLVGPMASSEEKTEMVSRSKEAITHGLTSWAQRQMHEWRSGSPERFDYRTNLSKTFVVGVGLPLMYGFKALVGLSAAITAVVLLIVQNLSGLRPVLMKFDEEQHSCHLTHLCRPKHVEELAAYAEYMFYACGGLYFVLLALAIWYSSFQRKFKRDFETANSTMSDYTLEIAGLSKKHIDETKLMRCVEKHLLCPGQLLGVSIAYDLRGELNGQVFDMLERRFINEDVRFHREGSDLAQAGWGYEDHLARAEHLDEDADARLFQQMWDEQKFKGSGSAFVVFKSKSQADAVRMKFTGLWMEDTITPQTEAEVLLLQKTLGRSGHDVPLEVLEDLTVPRETKEDHCHKKQFARLSAMCVVDDEWLQEGTKFYDTDSIAVGKPVKIERLVQVTNEVLEPTSTLWWNFGMRENDRHKKYFKTVLVIAVTFLVLVGVLYLPLFYYLATPMAQAGGSPGFMASQVQGILLGIAGNVLGITTWNSVCSLGHVKKPNQDIHFVRFSTFTNFFNTFFFLFGGLYYYVSHGFNTIDMTVHGHNTSTDIVSEWSLFQAYYNFLMPGWLFSGVLMGRVMGTVMPVLQNYLLVSVVFRMKCLPACLNELLVKFIPWNPKPDWLTARYAEHIFEPPEVALAWEYGQYIVTPTVCFMALFMMGPSSWQVFAILTLWVLFMYVMHRMTLHISKKQMAGSYLEEWAERAWAIPLATILSACGFWGVRCEKLGQPGHRASYWTAFFLFVCGMLLHWAMLRWFGNYDEICFDSYDATYEDVKQALTYTWFNTNPVHVLKSNFYPEKMGDAAIVEKIPFEYGKEYLFLMEGTSNSGKQDIELKKPQRKGGCVPGIC